MSRSMRLKLRRAKHPKARIPRLDDLRCPSGKFPFIDAAAARKAAAHLATQGRHVKAYPCRQCNRWHHTSAHPRTEAKRPADPDPSKENSKSRAATDPVSSSTQPASS